MGQSAVSIHQAESEYYAAHPDSFPAQPEGIRLMKDNYLSSVKLNKAIVYGFHPYWISDAVASKYHYNLLSHVVYFSGEADTAGKISTAHSWGSTQLVNYARQNGVKVHLCITMFSSHDQVLADTAKRHRLVKNIIAAMQIRNADGINIDFEGMAKAQADNFRSFIIELGSALKSMNKELAICLPAVDWGSVMFSSTFFARCNSVVDYYFMMGYDYYWSGSTTAGPVAPLSSGTSFWHVARSLRKFLSSGAPKDKLIAGFPYYGMDWPVVSNVRMSSVISGSKASSRTFAVAKAAASVIPAENKFFDTQYNVPWYRYQTVNNNDTVWHQTWYDDSLSLSKKYDTVKVLGLAGTGMWALGYDGTNTDLWGTIQHAFGATLAVNEDSQTVPSGFSLAQNYPNPFNPSTIISYQLPVAGNVSLRVFDILGRESALLVDEFQQTGLKCVRFGIQQYGLSSGVYYYTLQSGSFRSTKKMVILK
jgi:spore germination protein YaaH